MRAFPWIVNARLPVHRQPCHRRNGRSPGRRRRPRLGIMKATSALWAGTRISGQDEVAGSATINDHRWRTAAAVARWFRKLHAMAEFKANGLNSIRKKPAAPARPSADETFLYFYGHKNYIFGQVGGIPSPVPAFGRGAFRRCPGDRHPRQG